MARHTARRVVIFNHKGGVGKTTLTINVAHSLVSSGKRVLLVDSDPQCNLTAYLIEESVVNGLLDSSDSATGATIWSGLKPIVEATGDVRRIRAIEIGNGLYLLPGDIRLAEFEQELSQLWGECFQRKLKGFRGTTALSKLVNDICTDLNIDYVFYDSGPNIGPLNRVILLDCDGFIIPAACDLFSVRALKTLGHTLTAWIRDWKTISELAPDAVDLLPGHPVLIGYIPQRFRVYGGTLTSEYAEMLPQIEKAVYGDVVVLLERVDRTLVPFSRAQLKIGEVKDFGSIAVAAQKQGTPIAHVDAGTTAQREVARDAFNAIASQLVERVGPHA